MKIANIPVGLTHPCVIISGPCVIESESMAMRSAEVLCSISDELHMPFIYKSSFDKANRSSHESFRGLGISQGLEILAKIKQTFSLPILTDVHEDSPLREIADVVDVLQTPAFLCRQTNFIQNVAACNIPVNIKKGQFLSPWEMVNVVEKARAVGNQSIMVCERGASFGYNNLVSDMRSLAVMRNTGCPVIFDATHSVQLPGYSGKQSGGQREFVPILSRAAIAVGISGLFLESHPHPDQALSDGANSWPLNKMKALLGQIKQLDNAVKSGMLDLDGSVENYQ